MTRTYRNLTLVAAALFLLAACNVQGMLSVDPKAEALAGAAFDQLRNGQDDALVAELDPSIQTPQTRKMLATLRGFIPKGEPTAKRLVGWNKFAGTGGGRLTLIHQYDYETGVVTTQIVLVEGKAKGSWDIMSLNVNLGTQKNPEIKLPTAPPPAVQKT